jgi:hypothetical protein
MVSVSEPFQYKAPVTFPLSITMTHWNKPPHPSSDTDRKAPKKKGIVQPYFV